MVLYSVIIVPERYRIADTIMLFCRYVWIWLILKTIRLWGTGLLAEQLSHYYVNMSLILKVL